MAAEAAEVQAAAAPASLHERLKAVLSAPSDAPDSGASPTIPGGAERAQTRPASEPKAQAQGDEGVADAEPVPDEDQDEASDDVQSDDAQTAERQFSNLTELLEAAGLDSDKGYELELPVKIDGKEGTAKLRDLLKSYQLDGHINQRLAAVDTDRKALLAEREKFNGERADKLLRLDAGVKTLERALAGEFAAVNWEKLAAEDPAAYNASLVQFQQRNQHLQDIARSIQTEQAEHQAQLQEAMRAYLDEQRTMLQAKIPEWSDESRRVKDKAEIASVLKDAYGITAEEFEAITDHRHALVVRDAWNWQKLQKSKPATLNKVKAAPKLLKPGSPQSKASQDAARINRARETYRKTGRTSDGAAALKNILFGGAQ